MADQDAFLSQLRSDATVALALPDVEPIHPGPAHRAQFIVELVGPRSIPAASAAQLLSGQWHAALGQPEIYAMSPADTQWGPLSASTQGSYDSLAVCWDVLTARGSLSSATGQRLLQVCEQFAANIQRRAMPLPLPVELDRVAGSLKRLQENMDIGVSLVVLPRAGNVTEQELWIQCARLALHFGSSGSFEWRSPQHPMPLFEVTPIGQIESFSLRAVQAGATHEGATIGFNVPRCPAPLTALDWAIYAAEVIAQGVQGSVFDAEGRPLGTAAKDELRRDMQQAVQVLEEIGIKPGSAAALKIF